MRPLQYVTLTPTRPMKLLGYLFVVAVVLGLVGLARGWFTVVAATSHGRTDVQLRVDGDQIAKDASAAKDGVVALGRGGPQRAADAAATNEPGQAVEGRITAVDQAAQDLTIEVATQRSVHHVGPDVAITRDSVAFPFAQLRPEMRARLRFAASGSPQALLGIVVLP